jgi:hypothetical protein
MEEFPPGAEGDGELPMRAKGLGLMPLSSVDGSAGSSLGGTDGDTSEAAVVAKEGFADDPHNMEESPQGAEYDGELPLRAEGLGLVSLSSVGGSVGSSLGGTDWDTSGAAVVAIEVFSGDPHNMEKSPPGAEGDGLPLRAEGMGMVSLSSVDGSAGSSLGGTD